MWSAIFHPINQRVDKLEERFAFGEIDGEFFERVGEKLKQEIQSLTHELDKSGFQLSNPSLLIHQSLEIISNLSEFWASGDYDHTRRLQELLFPGGIVYDTQIDNYRTPNVNSILQ
jgi:site-specific DNA recombinase